MAEFKEISPTQIGDNPFALFEKDWALLTAGPVGCCNNMTISWGGIGQLWQFPVATVYVRPTRHTYQFMEQNDTFTLSFFDEEFRPALKLCGAKSGRDCDKIQLSGLTPRKTDKTTSFEEARLVLVCRKLYFADFQPEQFLDTHIEANYPKKDYHRMYIGKIEKVLVRD